MGEPTEEFYNLARELERTPIEGADLLGLRRVSDELIKELWEMAYREGYFARALEAP